MKKVKLYRATSLVLFVIIFSSVAVIFQNCSPNSSGGSEATIAILNQSPTEVNTTKAVNIRFLTAGKTVSSTDTIEIVAYAEDENGDVVTDFNYSGSITSTSPVSFCAPTVKFVNGEFKATISVQNNLEYDRCAGYVGDINYAGYKNYLGYAGSGICDVSAQFEIKTVVPTNMPFNLKVAASDPYLSINTAGNKPPPRTGATAIYDPIKNRILLFGGTELIEGSSKISYGYKTFNDIWELKLDGTIPEWNNITPSYSPPSRYGHTFVLDTTNNRGLLFGGRTFEHVLSGSSYEVRSSLAPNEIWSFDLQSDTWSVLNTNYDPPSPRMNHSSAYDSQSKRLYIFDGQNQSGENVGGIFALRLGGETPNWTSLPYTQAWAPPYPKTTSSTVTALYSNQTTKFYNPFYPEKTLSTYANYCPNSSREFNCIKDSYSVVLDTKQKAQWVFGTLETLSPRYKGDIYYQPIFTVLKKSIPVKLNCEK